MSKLSKLLFSRSRTNSEAQSWTHIAAAAIPNNVKQCHTIRCDTIRCDTMRYDTIRDDTRRYDMRDKICAIRYYAKGYDAIQLVIVHSEAVPLKKTSSETFAVEHFS